MALNPIPSRLPWYIPWINRYITAIRWRNRQKYVSLGQLYQIISISKQILGTLYWAVIGAGNTIQALGLRALRHRTEWSVLPMPLSVSRRAWDYLKKLDLGLTQAIRVTYLARHYGSIPTSEILQNNDCVRAITVTILRWAPQGARDDRGKKSKSTTKHIIVTIMKNNKIPYRALNGCSIGFNY